MIVVGDANTHEPSAAVGASWKTLAIDCWRLKANRWPSGRFLRGGALQKMKNPPPPLVKDPADLSRTPSVYDRLTVVQQMR